MLNFLLSCASDPNSAGCYDWPVIKEIVIGFTWFVGQLYTFLSNIGIANIGVVIILFTLIVKCVLLPLTIRQQKFTKLTNYMQPEIRAIQAKYQGRKDQESMAAMQAETKAVYQKYGVSQAGGCLQTVIQMPVLIALYGSLRQLSFAIPDLARPLTNVLNVIDGASASVKEAIGTTINTVFVNPEATLNSRIASLYNLPTKGWNELTAMFTGKEAETITSNHEAMLSVNSFLGMDLSQSPWTIMTGGGWGILVVFLPLFAGFSQWLSFKLSQTKDSATDDTGSAAASAKSMQYMMPLMSVFFCFTLSASLGLYWCIGSVFQVVLQIFINRHYRKIDMKEFVAKNMAKAKAKQEKEKAKRKPAKGEKPAGVISAAAATNTKNIERADEPKRPLTLAEKAGLSVDDQGEVKTAPNPNSLAGRAAVVAQYNEEHGTDGEGGTARRKYKK
ncbi:MAG: YidC/Oxa1 family membrane protein insertase [Parasporobacterium sp.]|nr:YidC/Oxa1 family membrane protein insertase [Parasporobacterium sp.]